MNEWSVDLTLFSWCLTLQLSSSYIGSDLLEGPACSVVCVERWGTFTPLSPQFPCGGAVSSLPPQGCVMDQWGLNPSGTVSTAMQATWALGLPKPASSPPTAACSLFHVSKPTFSKPYVWANTWILLRQTGFLSQQVRPGREDELKDGVSSFLVSSKVKVPWPSCLLR